MSTIPQPKPFTALVTRGPRSIPVVTKRRMLVSGTQGQQGVTGTPRLTSSSGGEKESARPLPPAERSVTPAGRGPSQTSSNGAPVPATSRELYGRSPSPYQRSASNADSKGQSVPMATATSNGPAKGHGASSNAGGTRITAALLSEHEHLSEARSIVVVGNRAWCADKERIVIRSVASASVLHVIHKTPDMGFIWVLERVLGYVWVGCSDGHIRVLNRTTYEELYDLYCHTAGIYCLLNYAGRVYSGGADFQLLQWNAQTAELLRKFSGTSSAIRSICPLECGRIASGSDDGVLRVWEIASGLVAQEWAAHSSSLRALAYVSDQDTLWTAGDDGRIRVWNPHTGANIHTLTNGHQGTVTQLHPFRGCVWSGGVDGLLIVWDGVTGAIVEKLRHHDGYVTCLALVQRAEVGTFWSIASDRVLKLWTCQSVTPCDADDQTRGAEDDVMRRLNDSEAAAQRLSDENAQLTEAFNRLTEANAQLTSTIQRLQPNAEQNRQVVQDLENAKGRAMAEIEALKSRAELADQLATQLREREDSLVRFELDRAAMDDNIQQANVQIAQLQDQVAHLSVAAHEGAMAQARIHELEQEFDDLVKTESRRTELLSLAGFSDVESLVRHYHMLEHELRLAKEEASIAMARAAAARRDLPESNPVRSNAPSSNIDHGTDTPHDAEYEQRNGDDETATDQHIVSMSQQLQAHRLEKRRLTEENEALRHEIVQMRSGQEYNVKRLLELQSTNDVLESNTVKYRDEIFARDTELSQQHKQVQSLNEKVQQLTDALRQAQSGRGADETETFSRMSSINNLGSINALKEIFTQCSTVRNTVSVLREDIRTRQTPAVQGGASVQDLTLARELQHVYSITNRLYSTIGNALQELNPELGSDHVVSRGGGGGRPESNQRSPFARDGGPAGDSNVKFVRPSPHRSTTPPAIIHTLTSSVRLQRTQTSTAPNVARATSPTPVKVSRASPGRSTSPSMSNRRPLGFGTTSHR